MQGSEDGSALALLQLTWTRQEEALAQAATLDGRYVLGTNLPTGTPTDLVAQAKRRDVPEKRFPLVKGPLAVRPVFVPRHDRILDLVWRTMVALLLYALLEWEARQAGWPQTGQVLLRHAVALQLASRAAISAGGVRHVAVCMRRDFGGCPEDGLGSARRHGADEPIGSPSPLYFRSQRRVSIALDT